MNQSDNEEDKLENRKRPYVKPEIVSDKAFETMALSCANQDFPTCGPGPAFS